MKKIFFVILTISISFLLSLDSPADNLPSGLEKNDIPQEFIFEKGGNKPDRFNGYNLIIIAVDPLTTRHLSLYGYPRETAPNLKAFAEKSYFFKNAISSSDWTMQSLMSLFTSLYPFQHKVNSKSAATLFLGEKTFSRLPEDVITLAQVLKRKGYSTGGFTAGVNVWGYLGFARGFDEYFDHSNFLRFDTVSIMALDWVRQHSQEKFFLFIHSLGMHAMTDMIMLSDTKRISDMQFLTEKEKIKYEKNGLSDYGSIYTQAVAFNKSEQANLSQSDVQYLIDVYDSKVFNFDKAFGRFMKELENFGLEDKTIIIVTSPSGEELYEHKDFSHTHTLYDELIHVPLIIHIPEGAGTTIEDQVRSIDIMPTALDLLRVNYEQKMRQQMQGVSLVPLFKNKHFRLDALSESPAWEGSRKLKSIRTYDGWKLIYDYENNTCELYDLNQDPEELNDLAGKNIKKQQELLQKFLQTFLKGMR